MMSMRLGLIGHPVKHSLSPPMHRAAFSYFGLSGTYELFDIEPAALAEAVSKFAEDGFGGFNITIPHKEAVFKLIERRSDEALLVGAANTVRIDSSGVMTAHNTDLYGFMKALETALQNLGFCLPFEKPSETCRGDAMRRPALSNSAKLQLPFGAIVLGAGGVARACIVGLFLSGYRKIFVAARRQAEALQICTELSSRASEYLQQKCEVDLLSFDNIRLDPAQKFSLAINCTSIGLHDEDAPWFDALASALPGNALFFDSVYRRDRAPTTLMKKAAAEGIQTVDGLEMLVEQAALAFEYWTGRRPPSQIMHEALQTHISS